jgi:hypothetical protein
LPFPSARFRTVLGLARPVEAPRARRLVTAARARRRSVACLFAHRRCSWPGGQLLVAALGFAGCSIPSYDRALHALRTWLDSWSGIGRLAVGMARQGYDLQLTRYDERGWRATFYSCGIEHSPTSATGSALEPTPWHATCARIRRGSASGTAVARQYHTPRSSIGRSNTSGDVAQCEDVR